MPGFGIDCRTSYIIFKVPYRIKMQDLLFKNYEQCQGDDRRASVEVFGVQGLAHLPMKPALTDQIIYLLLDDPPPSFLPK